ncbi:MAG: hypothetical protein EXS63_08305 [Candidatus Omnitrophica bacterium]|nr:hypothetical protein [Candidatus Omnitrophota bacterium]
MRYLFIRTQVIFLSLILLATFGLLLALGIRYNIRLDLTPGKVYSIAEGTVKTLKTMSGPVEILAFYQHEDPARNNFEVFLKQCQIVHSGLKYSFYDPQRVPNLAKTYHVRELYTVVLHYENRYEKIIQPTEQSFTNALIKLLQPKTIHLCFATGHKEVALNDKERSGYAVFQELLKENGYDAREIILSRDKVPSVCQVLVVAGPHQEFDTAELGLIAQTFKEGHSIFLMIDPMASGEGLSFINFMKQFGVVLGADVIVDKASRVAGGDFLVAMVTQYVIQHPITGEFQAPTFFPVSRSVQPSVEVPPGIEVVPLALSSPESWAETNLGALSNGEAKFEPSFDVMGPIPVAVAIEAKTVAPAVGGIAAPKPSEGGRMVVIGDSDFLTNGFISFSGNSDLALNIIQWLARDERLISLHPRQPQEFKPLRVTARKQLTVVLIITVGIPVFFLFLGLAALFRRKRLA